MGAPYPKLSPHLYESAHDLAPGLIMETDGIERLSSETPEDILLDEETFFRCRLTMFPIIRQSDLMARRMFPLDLRE